MLTFTKDGGTKIVSEDNKEFIKLIISHGWIEAAPEIKKKGLKNAESSTISK